MRRWFQFRLASLFVAVTIVAVGVDYFRRRQPLLTLASKHETAAKEESFGTFAQGVTFNEVIDVKGSGINQGQTVNWTLAYVAGYGNDSTLSPVTGINPSSGALTLNHVQDPVTLTFNTSTLAVQTYHGELDATAPGGVSTDTTVPLAAAFTAAPPRERRPPARQHELRRRRQPRQIGTACSRALLREVSR